MYIIDRFEGEYAVVEMDEETISIPLCALPAEAKEGDVLVKTETSYLVDAAETQARRERLIARRRRLLNGGCE